MEAQTSHVDTQNKEMEIDLLQLFWDLWKYFTRWWWLVLIVIFTGAAGLTGAQFFLYSPMYESSATFTVATGNEDSGSYSFYYNQSTADQLSKTFPYILDSSFFRGLLMEQLGTETINGTISSSTIESSNVVTMTVRSSDPQQAYDILQAALEIYPEAARFVLGSIRFDMLSEAQMASAPYNRLSVKKSAVLGGAAGFMVMAGFFTLISLFKKNVCTAEDMKKITSLRCFALLPDVRFKARGKKKGQTVAPMNKRIPYEYRESIRSLQSRVMKALSDKQGKVLLVTSTTAGEGKSTVAVNLAQSLAVDGYRVLLIDGDLRKQGDASIFGVKGKYGLADIIKGDARMLLIRDCVMEMTHKKQPQERTVSAADSHTGIWFVGSSSPVEQPAPVLANPKVKAFIDIMKDRADYIIIDSSPCSMFQDTGILSECADGILYVIRQDTLSPYRVREGLSYLKEHKTPILGYVLNHCTDTAGSYGYGKYGYGKYGYGRYGRYGHYGRYGYGDSGSDITAGK